METTGGPQQSVRAAFAQIAVTNEVGLMRLGMRLTSGNHSRAEDLVQETLVRAYEAYIDGRYDDGPNAWPWLQRILTNIFINDYNRRKRWDSNLDLDSLTFSGDTAPAQLRAPLSDIPGVTLLECTLDEQLERALSMLSPDLRQTIMLVDVEGLTYEEAASALSVPVGTVRSRLARARMKLHDLLQDFARDRGLNRSSQPRRTTQ
jgi:RNA polymerase sigma-70 factor (ECF subfamily)